MKAKEQRYDVQFEINGKAHRQVLASSDEDAVKKVQKMLFESDDITPKQKMIQAFCWEYRAADAQRSFWDMTEDEIELLNIRNRKMREILVAKGAEE